MRDYLEFTKSGIVHFVVISGLAGYFLSLEPGQTFSLAKLLWFLVSLYGFAAGSNSFNQIQDRFMDARMKRTSGRPVAAGRYSLKKATAISVGLLILGVITGFFVNELVVILGVLTVLLYNGFYTLIWKRRWAFGAVPGAIPGAMPVLMGYAVNSPEIWRPEAIYAFMILFLWQMPHYWALAIRYRKDYEDAGVPVLPVTVGMERAFVHIGTYTVVYVALAIAAPWFTSVRFAYLLFAFPFALKVLWEFIKYYRDGEGRNWRPFFLWTTFSVLIFLFTPVIDKWHMHLLNGI